MNDIVGITTQGVIAFRYRTTLKKAIVHNIETLNMVRHECEIRGIDHRNVYCYGLKKTGPMLIDGLGSTESITDTDILQDYMIWHMIIGKDLAINHFVNVAFQQQKNQHNSFAGKEGNYDMVLYCLGDQSWRFDPMNPNYKEDSVNMTDVARFVDAGLMEKEGDDLGGAKIKQDLDEIDYEQFYKINQ